MSGIRCRMVGDMPGEGECKLRIKSNGLPQETRVTIVDAQGVERDLLGVVAVGWKMTLNDDLAEATITVCEADVELEAEAGTVQSEGATR